MPTARSDEDSEHYVEYAMFLGSIFSIFKSDPLSVVLKLFPQINSSPAMGVPINATAPTVREQGRCYLWFNRLSE